LVSQPSVKTRMVMSILFLNLKALLSITVHSSIKATLLAPTFIITQQIKVTADRMTTITP
jgi:hypothetical protein